MGKVILDAETEEAVTPQVGYVDGYTFGDRQLEGVLFEIVIKDGEVVCNGPVDADNYMSDFSEKRLAEWNKSAVQAALDDSLNTKDGSRELFIDEVP